MAKIIFVFSILFIATYNSVPSFATDSSKDNPSSNTLYKLERLFYNTKSFASIYYLNKGKYALKKRRYTKAIRYLKRFIKQNTPIKDYGFFYLGKAYFYKRQYLKSSKYFRLLRKEYKGLSPLLVEASRFEGIGYIKSRRYKKLLKEFYSIKIDNTNKKLIASYSYFIAKANHLLKRHEIALVYYLKAIEYDKKAWLKKGIRAIVKLSSKAVSSLSYKDLESLAINYYHARRYRKSLRVLSKLQNKTSKANNSKIYYYKALCNIKLKRKKKAYQAFRESLATASVNSREYAKSLYYLYRNSSDEDKVKAYKVATLNSKSKSVLPFVKKLIRYYDKKGDYKTKSIFLAHLARRSSYNALWTYFMRDLNRGNLLYILKYYPKIISYSKNANTKSKFYFWFASIGLSLGKYDKALGYFRYSYLSSPYSYYGYKSLFYIKRYSKLGLFDENFRNIRQRAQDNERKFFNSSRYKELYKNSLAPLFSNSLAPSIERFLYFVRSGFAGYGKKEVEHFLYKLPYKRRARYYRAIGYFLYSKGLYQHSIEYLYRLIRYLNGSSSRSYIPYDLRKLLFPIRYTRYIVKLKENFDIDSFLVLAVIREESRFNPRAYSLAGAKGLMQIMPKTGRFLSRFVLGRRQSYVNLYNVSTNVNMGGYYLSNLIDRFDSVSHALAGYNGGPSRIRRFLRNSKVKRRNIINAEHIIELILIKETRDYVKKVLNSYFCYLDFYNQLR